MLSRSSRPSITPHNAKLNFAAGGHRSAPPPSCYSVRFEFARQDYQGPRLGRNSRRGAHQTRSSIVGIIVIVVNLVRPLQELRRVMARFARGRTLGRIAAELGSLLH